MGAEGGFPRLLFFSWAIAEMKNLANPGRFLTFASFWIPWIGLCAVLVLSVGLYLAFTSPPDYRQGELVRILYVHVPMAWLSMGCYCLIAVSGLGTLVWHHPLASVAARAAIPIGTIFTALTLISGIIWAWPTWGVLWVWDARLTSVLILFLLYLGLLALSRSLEDSPRSGRAVAILSLVGLVNVPIIKFSVDWWNTIHQPASLLRRGGPALHESMLWPLIAMALGFGLLFVWLQLLSMCNEIYRRRLQVLRGSRL